MSFQERSSEASDPMNVISSCGPILESPSGAIVSDLERACSNPSTNRTCTAREPCQLPLVGLSTVQPSSHHCQNLVSHGPHCATPFAKAAGMRPSPLPGMLIAMPSRRRSLDQLAAQHTSSPRLGAPAMSFAQPRTILTISAASFGVLF